SYRLRCALGWSALLTRACREVRSTVLIATGRPPCRTDCWCRETPISISLGEARVWPIAWEATSSFLLGARLQVSGKGTNSPAPIIVNARRSLSDRFPNGAETRGAVDAVRGV